MSSETTFLTPELLAYLKRVSLHEPNVLKSLRQETSKLPNYFMAISPEQGQLLALLVKLIGARRTLDVGTFTGYSALAVALALPPDGRVIACDIDPKPVLLGKQFWRSAGVENKIEVRLAPALETLENLLATSKENFDFIFIDADKIHYDDYYEKSLLLVRKGGVIAIDNVLWGGRVIDDSNHSPSTEILRTFNQKLAQDSRVDISMIPLGDGLTVARKR